MTIPLRPSDEADPADADAVLTYAAELEVQRDALLEAARAVVARWETPSWKDVEPTAVVIGQLRDAIAKAEGRDRVLGV